MRQGIDGLRLARAGLNALVIAEAGLSYGCEESALLMPRLNESLVSFMKFSET